MEDVKKVIRIILLGKTGEGKSATGNTLLHQSTAEPFLSQMGGSTVTKNTTYREIDIENIRMRIVDTPGFMDTTEFQESNKNWITNEVLKSTLLTVPGPHALLHVIRINRLTKEDIDTVEIILENFGKPVYDFIILVFTGTKNLDEGQTLQNYIETLPNYFQEYLRNCSNRYIGIDNRNSTSVEKLEFRKNLLGYIDGNNSKIYSNEILEKANQEFSDEVKKIQRKKKVSDDQAKKEVLKDIESEGNFFKYMEVGAIGVAAVGLVASLIAAFVVSGPATIAGVVATGTALAAKNNCGIM